MYPRMPIVSHAIPDTNPSTDRVRCSNERLSLTRSLMWGGFTGAITPPSNSGCEGEVGCQTTPGRTQHEACGVISEVRLVEHRARDPSGSRPDLEDPQMLDALSVENNDGVALLTPTLAHFRVFRMELVPAMNRLRKLIAVGNVRADNHEELGDRALRFHVSTPPSDHARRRFSPCARPDVRPERLRPWPRQPDASPHGHRSRAQPPKPQCLSPSPPRQMP